MISVDFSQIEILCNKISRALSLSDDAYAMLHFLNEEITNDLEMQTYPQYVRVSESVKYSCERLKRINERLQLLSSVLSTLIETFNENETDIQNDISRISILLNSTQTNISLFLDQGDAFLVEQNEQTVSYSKLQQLVSDNVVEMELTNISAITAGIQRQYSVQEIVDLSYGDSDE